MNEDDLTAAYMSGLHDGKKAAQREWVRLTEEEVKKEVETEMKYYLNGEYIETWSARYQLAGFAKVIEAKLKEKNT